MKRLSDNAIEIVNELHTERLAYESEYVPIINALNRLAEYEDIGLEPEKIVFLKNVVEDAFSDKPEFTEHIRELLRTEKDGRLMVLPCKIGATVYRFQRYFNDATCKSEIKIKPCVVESVSTKCIITNDHMVMLFSNFGKTVFLTREEAEKALEEV